MGFFSKLFGAKSQDANAASSRRCSVCSRTSEKVEAAKRKAGQFPIPPLVGVCPTCNKAYCVDHAPYDSSIDIDSIVCPTHRKVALKL